MVGTKMRKTKREKMGECLDSRIVSRIRVCQSWSNGHLFYKANRMSRLRQPPLIEGSFLLSSNLNLNKRSFVFLLLWIVINVSQLAKWLLLSNSLINQFSLNSR